MFVKLLRGIGLVALAAAVVLPCGCGSGRPKTFPVRGKVTYKGQPVPCGSITFVPDGGTAATGQLDSDGSYSLTTFRKGDGAIVGTHKVVITAMQDRDSQPLEAWSPLPPPLVPTKYMNLSTSDLRAEVKEEENTINFNLEDPKKR